MQTALNYLASGLNGDRKPVFNVVIVYEDFETGKNAKRTYDYLASNLGDDCEFSNQMWKFDVLSLPKLARIAAQDAVEADIILVATHGGQLPRQVKEWLEAWASNGTKALALVALCDGEPAAAHLAITTLRDAARRAGTQFFAQPDFWPGDEGVRPEPAMDGLLRARDRGFRSLAGAVPAQAARDISSAPRWGLNE